MPLLEEKDKKYIENLFAKKLVDPIKILVFIKNDKQECPLCEETKQIVEEVANTSDHIKVEVYQADEHPEKVSEYNVEYFPAIILINEKVGKDVGVRFYGIHSGYEFSTLLEDIIDMSQSKIKLSPETIEKLKSIDKKVVMKVFVTPSCPYCPIAVKTAHKFAMVNDNIVGVMIEAMEFPQLAQKYGVSGVPKTVINDKEEILGAAHETTFLNAVLKAIE